MKNSRRLFVTILVGDVLFRTVTTRIYYKILRDHKFAPSVSFFSLVDFRVSFLAPSV